MINDYSCFSYFLAGLALNLLESSCLYFLTAAIIGVYYHAWDGRLFFSLPGEGLNTTVSGADVTESMPR